MSAVASIRIGKKTFTVPATIFGHNLELLGQTSEKILSERLLNPQFAGPANPDTGLAAFWHPPSFNFSGIHYQHIPGEGLMGREAQMLENTCGRPQRGIVQPERWIQAGERLEVEFWARTQHHPVTLQVGLMPAACWNPPYVSAQIEVDSPIFKRYSAVLEIGESDSSATFFCFLNGKGRVFLDQMHLRPIGAGIMRTDIEEKLGSFDIPVLRFPGGCITSCYHWQFGTGPQHLRPILPDPVFKGQMRYEFGTDEYLAFCSKWRVTPHITVNTGAATIAEASEWARYCADWYRQRGEELPLMYWQLGNESYGHWSREHMSGERYAELVREMAPGIRAAYPKARILALGQSEGDGFYLDEAKRPWRKPLLDRAADVIDGLVTQNYCIVPFLPHDVADQHHQVFEAAEWMASVPRNLLADLEARRLDLQVGISEWNLWTRATHFHPDGFREPMDMQHALFSATMFHHFARLAPRFSLANYYHIIDSMGLFTVDNGRIHASLVAEIFSLYREVFPAAFVELDMESPSLTKNSSILEALAVESKDRPFLFLVNRSLDTSLLVGVEDAALDLTAIVISAESPLSTDFKRSEISAEKCKIVLPPLSIVRATWKRTA